MKDPQIKKQLTQISQDMNAQKNIIVWKNRVFVPIQERQKKYCCYENCELDKQYFDFSRGHL